MTVLTKECKIVNTNDKKSRVMNDNNDAPEEVAAIRLPEDVVVSYPYLKSQSKLYIQAVQCSLSTS